jgi:hypothetical protein
MQAIERGARRDREGVATAPTLEAAFAARVDGDIPERPIAEAVRSGAQYAVPVTWVMHNPTVPASRR